jgi:hypothetical protein
MRPIHEIAGEIARDWKPVNYAAKPYLGAMFDLATCADSYGADSGKSIVLYFLSNANAWRGPVAKRCKAELKAHAGLKLTKAEREAIAPPV